MESLQEKITLLKKVCEIYKQLSKLETLKPCNHVDNLFTELVHTCIPHSSINITTLPESIHEIRIKLIRLCGEAEGHLEARFSIILGSFKNPLLHLTMFPYYSNYLKLNRLEYTSPPSTSPLLDLAPYPSPQSSWPLTI
ncbi:putative nicotianamine synthase [Helianthus debilis subsp. tardiflorus]